MADNMPSGPEFRTGRSDSTSSTSSTTSNTSPLNSIISGMPKAPAMPPRRRSGHLFEGLEAQKRSSDPAAVARRQSMNEQRPKSGILGSMWNNWVHGEK